MTHRSIPTARLGWRLVRTQPWRYAANLALWTLIWVIPIVPGLLTRAFFDGITGSNPAGPSVATLIALILGYGVARIGVMWLAMWNDVHFMFRIGATLRRNMIGRVFELPGARALEESPGEAISRFREDVDETEETVSWTADMVGMTVFATIAIAILVSIDARITAFVFAPTVAVVYLAALARRRVRRYREAAREATGKITDSLGETFGAVQSIKVAGAERSMVDHFRALNDARKAAMVKDQVLTAILESLFWNTVNIGTGLILIAAAQSIGSGAFTVGDFALFVYFLGFVSEAVFILGLFIARYQQATVSFGRMTALLGGATPERLAERRDLGLRGPLPDLSAGSRTVEPLRELRVAGLTFHYPGSSNGIQDVDLVVPRGSFTVVTGRIGSGKTTLLRAILGLVNPDSGTVLWNGVPVQDPAEFFIPPVSAYTPQVPRLFSLSLRDNLLLGRRDADARLQEAIRSAVLDDDVDTMPTGLATMVGPLGVRLSGGQVQRSAAARMFVRRPELLVFDDLSSALDVETEKLLWERLFSERNGVTSLVVSHRRPALQRADQIVVLEAGRITAVGRVGDLLASSAEFRRLWERESLG
jgi:ATP-binding cassette subfamily B protein